MRMRTVSESKNFNSWHEGATCQVKVGDGILSEPYPILRGVKQGSVLSPALFLLVMDPLLRLLGQSGLGLLLRERLPACQDPCHKYRLS